MEQTQCKKQQQLAASAAVVCRPAGLSGPGAVTDHLMRGVPQARCQRLRDQQANASYSKMVRNVDSRRLQEPTLNIGKQRKITRLAVGRSRAYHDSGVTVEVDMMGDNCLLVY